MIIPIGLEDYKVQRFPVVTVGLMIACAVIFIATTYLGNATDGVDSRVESVLNYLEAHPYLEPSPELVGLMNQCWGEEGVEKYLADLRKSGVRQPYPERIPAEQRELDERTHEMMKTMGTQPTHQWGLVPGDPSFLTFLTHMFLHAGLIHLLGNLLFLYLAGPLIEDRWGRFIFLVFYLMSGLAAGGAHVLGCPDSMIPLVGASGAIAGAMGAFLFRFWKKRIRFFYLFIFFIRGTFLAPAWLILPLWLAGQIASAKLVEHLGLVGGGGVAHWAHIGGFIFGSMFALFMVSFGFEQKILGLSRNASTSAHLVCNSVIEEAMAVKEAGDGSRAFGLLSQAYRRDPHNVDVGLALWGVALDNGWKERAAPVMLRVIHEELCTDQTDLAIDHWIELSDQIPFLIADPGLLIRVAGLLTDCGFEDDGRNAIKLALQQPEDRLTVAMTLKIAKQLQKTDRKIAREAVEMVLLRSDILPDEKEQATTLLHALPGAKSA